MGVHAVRCDEPKATYDDDASATGTVTTAVTTGATETMMSEQQSGAQTLERDHGQASTPERPVLDWLRSEFPDWDVRIERTTTADGRDRPLWIALRDGHHPQSELTAAKLHSRLADYLDREVRRNPSRN